MKEEERKKEEERRKKGRRKEGKMGGPCENGTPKTPDDFAGVLVDISTLGYVVYLKLVLFCIV